MSRSLRIASLMLLVLATLVLGACGGGSDDVDKKNAYVRDLNAAQAEFAADASSVARHAVPANRAARIRFVQRFGLTIDQAVAKLRRIDVPGDVRAEHQQLIEAMTGFRGDVQKLTWTYRGGDAHKLPAALAAFSAAQAEADKRIDATIAAINSKLAAS